MSRILTAVLVSKMIASVLILYQSTICIELYHLNGCSLLCINYAAVKLAF